AHVRLLRLRVVVADDESVALGREHQAAPQPAEGGERRMSVVLDPGTAVDDRPFTALEHTRADLAALARMRAALAVRVASGRGAGVWTEDGEAHLLVAPRPEALTRPTFAVGFFSQARD